MQQEDKIKEILTAQSMAFEALDIIDQIKVNKNYIPTTQEFNHFIELQEAFKIIHEDMAYITSCMQRRMGGQHEHKYLQELCREAMRDVW